MNSLIRAVEMLFNILEILVVARVFMSLFRISLDNTIGKIISDLTDPVIIPAKLLLSKLGLDRGMIDFSPIVSILLLRLVYSIVMRILLQL